MLASRMTSKGQVTIPKELREWLGVREGDRVAFVAAANGSVEIHKLGEQQSIAGCLKSYVGRSASESEIQNAIDQGWSKRGRS